mmetsp:Transcript_46320/g.153557  ORF Transcript_46320/g.153557 Transcript_46320/m.153557 type:complete len:325 (-) Transcript_46320:9-983(-)
MVALGVVEARGVAQRESLDLLDHLGLRAAPPLICLETRRVLRACRRDAAPDGQHDEGGVVGSHAREGQELEQSPQPVEVRRAEEAHKTCTAGEVDGKRGEALREVALVERELVHPQQRRAAESGREGFGPRAQSAELGVAVVGPRVRDEGIALPERHAPRARPPARRRWSSVGLAAGKVVRAKLGEVDDAKVQARRLERGLGSDAAGHAGHHSCSARLVVEVEVLEEEGVHPPPARRAEGEQEEQRARAGEEVGRGAEIVDALDERHHAQRQGVGCKQETNEPRRRPKATQSDTRLHRPRAVAPAHRGQHQGGAGDTRDRVRDS